MNKWMVIIITMLHLSAEGQGLFETAGESATGIPGNFLPGGYIRSALYLGKYTGPLPSEIRSGYGEIALNINATGSERARFYSEVRLRNGYEYNEWTYDVNLREAYVDLYLDRFDFRLGQQIIAWGRTDAFNPTHNITPGNYFVRSTEADDMNLGNFMLRGRYHPSENLWVEAVWVPVYKYSIYRFDLFDMPDYVSFKESNIPEAKLGNGSFAGKIELFLNKFDGSLSWFSGYDPMPGIEAGSLPASPSLDLQIKMFSKAFRQQTLGLDFSCGIGSFGVRGEAALRIPANDFKDEIFAAEQDIRYVLEADRSFGNLSLIFLYAGQYVFDFTESTVHGEIPDIDPSQIQDPAFLDMLGPMLDEHLRSFNRIIFNQTREISHSLGFRPAFSIFHDIIEAEIFGLYNFSTEEWNIYPLITWRATDELKLNIGGQYFKGPQNTAYDWIAPVFNGGFLELRYTF